VKTINILETIICILLIVLFLLTAITEPQLSYEYSKAYVSSGVKAVNFVIEKVNRNVTEKEMVINNETGDIK